MNINHASMSGGLSRRRFVGGATAAAIGALALSARQVQAAGTDAYPNAIKLVSVCRKRSDLTDEQFYDYWKNSHGPYASIQVTTLGAFRYIQNHTQYIGLTDDIRADRGETERAFEGITQVWFPSAQLVMERSLTPEGLLANINLTRDELNFIDVANSTYFFSYEHVIIDG